MHVHTCTCILCTTGWGDGDDAVQGSPVTSGKEEEGEFFYLDVSFVSDGSIYIPTPQNEVWGPRACLEVPVLDSVFLS